MVANVDLLVGCAVFEPSWCALVVAVLSPVMVEIGAAGGDSDE